MCIKKIETSINECKKKRNEKKLAKLKDKVKKLEGEKPIPTRASDGPSPNPPRMETDIDLVRKNERQIDALILLSADTQYEAEFVQLKKDLGFLVPSDKSEIVEIDKKIAKDIDIITGIYKDTYVTSEPHEVLIGKKVEEIKLALIDRHARSEI